MEEYYVEQEGNGGLDVFTGHRYHYQQRGRGWFTNFIKGKIWPAIKKAAPYLGLKVAEATGDIAEQINEGETFGKASKKAMKRKLSQVADDALIRIKNKLQNGDGLRRAKRRRTVKRTATRRTSIKGRKSRKTNKRLRKVCSTLF